MGGRTRREAPRTPAPTHCLPSSLSPPSPSATWASWRCVERSLLGCGSARNDAAAALPRRRHPAPSFLSLLSQCDLLIATLALPTSAHALSPNLLPAAGRDATGDGAGPATELQLHSAAASPIAVLQQRAPAAPGRATAHAADVVALARAAGVARLVVLGSVDAGARRDAGLAGPAPVPVTAAGMCEELMSAAAAAGVPALVDGEFEPPRAERRLPPWPLLASAAENGPPTLALLAFASDGDNAADAVALATVAARVLLADAAPKAWTVPPAWRAVYGGGARVEP